MTNQLDFNQTDQVLESPLKGNPFFRWLFLALLFPVVYLNGWLVLQIIESLQPFVSLFLGSILLAFLLSYPVSFLEKLGVKRDYAVIGVFLISLGLLALLGLILAPILIEELGAVLQAFPDWISSGKQQLNEIQNWFISERISISVSRAIARFSTEVVTKLDDFADRLLTITLLTLSSLSQALLVLVLAFYFLLDSPRLVEGFFKRFPAHFRDRIQQSLKQNFQNYFVSQVTLGLITGTLMTLAFLLLGVKFALLFGISAGVMAIIPFGDVLIFSLVGIISGLQDIGLGVKVIFTAIFLDQFIDQGVAPRLLGKFVGLRPVAIISALVIGAKVGGVLGLIVAVPVASFVRDSLNGFPDYEPVENRESSPVALGD